MCLAPRYVKGKFCFYGRLFHDEYQLTAPLPHDKKNQNEQKVLMPFFEI
jgi:hypothetical protein